MPTNAHIKNLFSKEKFNRKRDAKLRLLNVEPPSKAPAKQLNSELPFQNFQYANGQTFQLLLPLGNYKKLADVSGHVQQFIPRTTRGCDDPVVIYQEEECYNQFRREEQPRKDRRRNDVVPLTFYACSNPYNATTVNDINPVLDVLKADCHENLNSLNWADAVPIVASIFGIGVLICAVSGLYHVVKNKNSAGQVLPQDATAPVNPNMNMP